MYIYIYVYIYIYITIDRNNINVGKKWCTYDKTAKNHQDIRFWLTVKLTTRLHLVPRSRMREALPPLPSMYLYLHVWAGTNVPLLTYSELRI